MLAALKTVISLYKEITNRGTPNKSARVRRIVSNHHAFLFILSVKLRVEHRRRQLGQILPALQVDRNVYSATPDNYAIEKGQNIPT